jgi:hypothetical protein
VTNGGDGFYSRVDPKDPNIIYAESQNGGLVRFDRRTGERVSIQPQPKKGDPALRWNWDAPLVVSSHSNTRLYFGAQKLYRSDDRGDTWREISPDLTRALDRNKLPLMGKIWPIDAIQKNVSTALYDNISAIAESPKLDGLLYVARTMVWCRSPKTAARIGARSISRRGYLRMRMYNESWLRNTMPVRCTWPTITTKTATSNRT